jgi:hypothetical protein
MAVINAMISVISSANFDSFPIVFHYRNGIDQCMEESFTEMSTVRQISAGKSNPGYFPSEQLPTIWD